jgi:Uma2 family endonuclease
MAMLIADPWLEEKLKEQRKAWGADHHDEVWEGVYFMAPLPNDEHQELVMALGSALYATIDGAELGKTRPGVNLAGFGDNWEHDYRIPDVVVFLKQTAAENLETHWRGAADFVVEITSPADRTYEKIPFYSRLGVRELLIVDRQPWALKLYRLRESTLEQVAASTLQQADILDSAVLPLRFQLVAGQPRPQIEITHVKTGQHWLA